MLAFLKQIPFWESYLELRKWHLIYTSRFNTGLKLYNGQYNWTDGSKIQLTFWDAYQVIHSASNFNCFISNTSGYWYYGECQTYHTNPYVCKYSRGKSKSTSIFFYFIQVWKILTLLRTEEQNGRSNSFSSTTSANREITS